MKVFLFIVVWFILVAMPVIWAMTHNISDIAIVWFIAAFLLPSIKHIGKQEAHHKEELGKLLKKRK